MDKEGFMELNINACKTDGRGLINHHIYASVLMVFNINSKIRNENKF